MTGRDRSRAAPFSFLSLSLPSAFSPAWGWPSGAGCVCVSAEGVRQPPPGGGGCLQNRRRRPQGQQFFLHQWQVRHPEEHRREYLPASPVPQPPPGCRFFPQPPAQLWGESFPLAPLPPGLAAWGEDAPSASGTTPRKPRETVANLSRPQVSFSVGEAEAQIWFPFK